jgi:hypothetical protein
MLRKTQTRKISRLPAWLGALRRLTLGEGERLIEVRDGRVELAIVCPADDGAELVYSRRDWEMEAAPTWGFDSNGTLGRFLAGGSLGTRAVAYREVEVTDGL